VVLPTQEPDVVRLRPLTGREDEAIGLFLPFEGDAITPSTFALPDPNRAGDTPGGMLVRDAARLSLRDGAAPFRSMGRLSVAPRPYQFVPLIMALRLDPVRMLIADDVGVGKTIEAGMIARELLDRGVARRLAVICPAHLCDQWEAELRDKFGIAAAVVQPSRIARLERDLPRGDIGIYEYYPHLIVSIDYVKTDRNRDRFIHDAPDLIIVDEAHMASRPRGDADGSQQQRYDFLRRLVAERKPHLLLVTATPHSGIEEGFRSLLGLLDPTFDTYGVTPAPLDRRALLPHVVQRRRKDVQKWLGNETPFPDREALERTYSLSGSYRALFESVLRYCRESIGATSGLRVQQQRVRYWAAIALLRCVLSSPEAAVSVLSERAKRYGENTVEAESGDDLDATYGAQVLDPTEEERASDYVPSAPLQDANPHLQDREKDALGDILRRARAIAGPKEDQKLAMAAKEVAGMLRDGYRPIVFCHFIATAKYLEAQLAVMLKREFPDLHVVAVTGEISDEERRERIAELTAHPVRVLVATDCLSEGINLQEDFDAVLHFDLPWNPNRLEQREGRVDRFGQPKATVRTVLLYGADNEVDLIVLDVLLRKARTIRSQLGISVPVPVGAQQVVQAVVDSLLLRGPSRAAQLQLSFDDPSVSRLHSAWDDAANKEKETRTYFAQHGIAPDEVAEEIAATVPVLGDGASVQRFLANAAQRFGGELHATKRAGVFELYPGDMHQRLGDRGYGGIPLRVVFDKLADPSAITLGRTHPVVAAYCDAVLGAALSPDGDAKFARSGARFTDSVRARTGVLLLRFRYLLRESGGSDPIESFAEEVTVASFERRDGKLAWHEPFDERPALLLADARAVANMTSSERADHVRWALDFVQQDPKWYTPVRDARVRQLRESHDRLRKLTKARHMAIDPHPPDILGCYVLVPGGDR